MKRVLKRVMALVACLIIVVSMPTVAHAADKGYTYTFDYWGDVQYSPDAYTTVGMFTATDLGLEKNFLNPQGLTVYGDYIYICDTGNNRILEIHRTDVDQVELVREIKEFKGAAEVTTFKGPTDVAVSEDYIWVADKDNNRIVKLDKELNYIMEFTKPTDETFDQSWKFLPSKIVVDTAGRVFCVATNVNKGLLKYENDGTFSGFIGATPVSYDWWDYIYKRFSTAEQRAKMESFVPTEYDNLYMDHEGFIYACTTHASELEIDSGQINPVRRLNMMGDDILIRNGNWYIIGDIHWDAGGGYTGPSRLIDVTTFENDSYAVLDRNRGRIFVYDDQGRMLFAFGGSGNMDGYFRYPVGIEHMGYDLLILDQTDSSLTIMAPTEYGNLIYQAIDQFQNGEYTESGESWEEVLTLNGNYDLAYIGIGRSLLRQERYREAMDYFELKWDDDNYSKAFKQYRKIWVEEHIVQIMIVLVAVVVIPLVIGRIKRVKWEIDNADIFKRNH